MIGDPFSNIKKLFYLRFKVPWLYLGTGIVNYLSFWVNQELSKIPRDILQGDLTSWWVLNLRFEVLVHWMSIWSIYFNLLEQGKVNFVSLTRKLEYFILRFGFLLTKLVAREAKDLQTPVFVFIIKFSQLAIIGVSESTLWGHIDNKSAFIALKVGTKFFW